MNAQSILEQMKNIQKDLLEYLDDNRNIEENFQNISNKFIDQKISDDANKLKILLHLILRIGNLQSEFEINFFSFL